MGIFDKAKDLAAEHGDAIQGGIDKVADHADQRTQGKYGEHIDRGAAAVKDRAAALSNRDDQAAPPA